MYFLGGLRVLNTRPVAQGQELSRQISAAQGIAINCPALEIVPTPTQWHQQIPDLSLVQHAVFTSANAVIYGVHVLNKYNIQWPATINVVAIGQGSAQALQNAQIPVHYIPEIADSEHLIQLPIFQQLSNQSIVLFKGQEGRDVIEHYFIQKKARLTVLEVYQRTIPDYNPHFINSIWQDDKVDIILMTSEQSIKNIFQMFHQQAHGWLRHKPCVVLSRRLAASAALWGMQHIIISHPHHILKTLSDYYQGSLNG